MAKPYVKWAGGKSQLAAELIGRFPDSFSRYIEPFCGSAAIFFLYMDRDGDIFSSDIPEAWLNDSNYYLMNCHKQISEQPEDVMRMLACFEVMYKQNPENVYRDIRKIVVEDDDEATMAARFIFINKTCFNGLWRVNSKGKFNTPWNQTTSVNTFVHGNIIRCSKLLQNTKMTTGHFRDVIKEAYEGDFLFVDPPYEPVSDSSSFTGYTPGGWTIDDTLELSIALDEASDRGAKFIMTNSVSPVVYNSFSKFKITTVEAHRFVKAVSSDETREKVKETIITNY
jgi:DNA adenine methylase